MNRDNELNFKIVEIINNIREMSNLGRCTFLDLFKMSHYLENNFLQHICESINHDFMRNNLNIVNLFLKQEILNKSAKSNKMTEVVETKIMNIFSKEYEMTNEFFDIKIYDIFISCFLCEPILNRNHRLLYPVLVKLFLSKISVIKQFIEYFQLYILENTIDQGKIKYGKLNKIIQDILISTLTINEIHPIDGIIVYFLIMNKYDMIKNFNSYLQFNNKEKIIGKKQKNMWIANYLCSTRFSRDYESPNMNYLQTIMDTYDQTRIGVNEKICTGIMILFAYNKAYNLFPSNYHEACSIINSSENIGISWQEVEYIYRRYFK